MCCLYTPKKTHRKDVACNVPTFLQPKNRYEINIHFIIIRFLRKLRECTRLEKLQCQCARLLSKEKRPSSICATATAQSNPY